jgi:hypothetical protein
MWMMAKETSPWSANPEEDKYSINFMQFQSSSDSEYYNVSIHTWSFGVPFGAGNSKKGAITVLIHVAERDSNIHISTPTYNEQALRRKSPYILFPCSTSLHTIR